MWVGVRFFPLPGVIQASHCRESECRCTYKYEASHHLSDKCWPAKDLPSDHELEARASKSELALMRGLPKLSRCSKLITITSHFEHFLYRMSICVQFRDSVTPALQMSGSRCPSARWQHTQPAVQRTQNTGLADGRTSAWRARVYLSQLALKSFSRSSSRKQK